MLGTADLSDGSIKTFTSQMRGGVLFVSLAALFCPHFTYLLLDFMLTKDKR